MTIKHQVFQIILNLEKKKIEHKRANKKNQSIDETKQENIERRTERSRLSLTVEETMEQSNSQ
jgi:hypothetical protein